MTPDAVGAVTGVMAARAHLAMFPLSNLERLGLDGVDDLAMSLWWDGASVVGVTRSGMVLPFGDPAAAPGMAAAIVDRDLVGVIGERRVARALLAAAGLTGVAATLDRDEPQFLLDLAAMVVPPGPSQIVPLADVDQTRLTGWIAAYTVEALNVDPVRAQAQAEISINTYIAARSHHVLCVDDAPVALTDVNAQVADMVQVGGVYVPPALRGRGHARRAVAMDLARLRDRGLKRATLFASGPAAARAYRSIGFTAVGDWTLSLFDGPQRGGLGHGTVH
ncbi:GNAT family N-acetyltransferase [Loktanella sp. TSTF-M6]|uniref:GNAT family N-acetyltransferase n=1 Tax=Loktanella gaetbuli TaxID=2881335 RepID=A0ABS8BVX8_9RHOB|nr:GNAT family N-acetyltransferase [Loktanella gaetbuli]MCB5199893.1 GNAT family N-acetyltransferase [Loktanella gaetbuli]